MNNIINKQPLYDQIVDLIKEKIETEYLPNSKLESERKLTERYGVSRTTVRMALLELEKLGYIYRKQGQQRTVALVLKLSEIRLVKHIFNKDAILLLDDVLSELDRSRQTILLDMVENSQTFITCTGMEEFIENKIDSKRIYRVTQGSVEEVRR